mmetsp:Transcript_34057/g.107382  ORF Transcript_34057/g.107382 Transcript_34057/m.107382 type:complete len:304 (-) Transcript_34057:85-996(-)|eukprot:CAMPEP_0118867442 /NCGR_PEP_ID=MMETSP1163-20130328/11033_1 /TAXON_ID=124430 /ORGANISM="Phaeomonas parva, Strain CCMP2877" /LENGTH=303 /DNA_ID=CAMNT_0006801857 /DNA_START=112 /DNA_END=1023 /DNA_ORIENTATION=+
MARTLAVTLGLLLCGGGSSWRVGGPKPGRVMRLGAGNGGSEADPTPPAPATPNPTPPEPQDDDKPIGGFMATLTDMAEQAEKQTAKWVEESQTAQMELAQEKEAAALAELEAEPEPEIQMAYRTEMEPPIRREIELEGSEWRVATVWKPRGPLAKIFPDNYKQEETWLRLAKDKEKDELVAVWGNDRVGEWAYREDTKTLTASSEFPVFDALGSITYQPDFLSRYYMMGWVRGWSIFESVDVWGLFEAVRIDKAGKEGIENYTAPWEQMREMSEEEVEELVAEELSDLEEQTDWFLPPEDPEE